MKKLFSLVVFILAGIILPAQADTTSKTTVKDTSDVFSFAEVMPVFPGSSLLQFVTKNFVFPAGYKEKGPVTFWVSFIVEKDGTVTNVKVNKIIPNNDLLNKEIVRVFSVMPKWSPGMMQGKPIRVEMSQKIILETE